MGDWYAPWRQYAYLRALQAFGEWSPGHGYVYVVVGGVVLQTVHLYQLLHPRPMPTRIWIAPSSTLDLQVQTTEPGVLLKGWYTVDPRCATCRGRGEAISGYACNNCEGKGRLS